MLVAMTCICLSIGVIGGLVLVPSLLTPSIVSTDLCGTLFALGTTTIYIYIASHSHRRRQLMMSKNQWVHTRFSLRLEDL